MQSCLYEFLQTKNDISQLIVSDDKEANLVKSVFSIQDIKPFILPDIRVFYGDNIRTFSDEFFHLNKTMYEYYKYNKKKILITPLATSFLPNANKSLFKDMNINFAQDIEYENFKNTLFYWGYSFVDLVEVKGEVSFRGDTIDIFPINSDTPYRISTFDDEVDSIKAYNISTQITTKNELEEITIIPALFGFDKEQYGDIINKIDFSDNNSFVKDISSLGLWFLGDLAFTSIYEFKSILLHKDLKNDLLNIFELENIDTNKDDFLNLPIIKPATNYRDIAYTKDYKTLIEFNKDKKIIIYCASKTLLKQFDLEDIQDTHKIIFSDEKILISSKTQMIISIYKNKNKAKIRQSKIILDELKIGEIVVHHTHGVGIFEGIEHTKVMGRYKDYMCIIYQNNDKLLIPMENLGVIDRYVVDSGSTPALDKLGKGSFAKLKVKVKVKLLEIADKIVSIAARRELVVAQKINIDNSLMQNFQKNAGFDYTDDQIKSVEEILGDFSSGKVMDRLLVGDVGFGKTEVALNAIVATVLNDLQVLFVAPTTLLSNQHYKSLENRLKPLGIRVAKINRFVKAKEKKEIYELFKDGNIPVIIGTHATFNIVGKKIGLVIIDEEHKFGVQQKENLKNITKNVHLLSMSATPIPRSLNLALSHIKTISYLTIPPLERKPIRTYVKEYSDIMLKEAINREIRRDGQIFYIYNHIKTINEKAQEIQSILPDLKILILHSQVSVVAMENGMLAFENKEYDLMLCTSIIESGIHIPNANTMIIDGSDRFGLADLHQLRGRVGRASKEGFCYFLVKDKEEISQNSIKRLSALETHSSLGSGSLIARQDLEIRGAGNILGEVQSGNIQGVGYTLYVKMLEESLQSLSNTQLKDEKEIDIKLSIDKFINSSLISEDRLRLDIYRRLSKCKETQDVYDIEEEINDRFGKLDIYTSIFLDVIIIKILALKQDIKLITNYEKRITIVYANEKTITLNTKEYDNREIVDKVLNFLKTNT